MAGRKPSLPPTMKTTVARAPDPRTDSAPTESVQRPHLAALRADLAGLIPELRAYARFLARDRNAADDLVQDTLLRALGALDRYEPSGTLRAWLFTIQRNVFYEQARRRRTERLVLAQALPSGEPVQRPHQDGETEIADLQRLLWILPPLLREALVLVGAQGMSYEEAACVCGVPTGTMKARVSRARTQIAKAMDGSPQASAPDQIAASSA
jgi:RNA polymerase sigma-70 factor (ECF subfamily)